MPLISENFKQIFLSLFETCVQQLLNDNIDVNKIYDWTINLKEISNINISVIAGIKKYTTLEERQKILKKF